MQESVWFPLPAGFDQSKPDEILGHVRTAAQKENKKLEFSHVYVFGDSSCDTHNFYLLKNKKDPDPKVYWKGRVSNGPMWPDYLENYYSLQIINHAYSGATVLNLNFANDVTIPDFSNQVDNYKATKLNASKPLAIIQFCGNDLQGSDITAEKVVHDIEEQLQRLVDEGEIKHFLVLETPIVDFIHKGFNVALQAMVGRFQVNNSQVSIATQSVIENYIHMVSVPPPTSDPGKWHPPSEFCYDETTGEVRKDPQNYLLFDKYHPTTVPQHNLAVYIGLKIRSLEWL